MAPDSDEGARGTARSPKLAPMARWRILSAVGLVVAVGLTARQVQRLAAGETGSDALTWATLLAAAATALAVMTWTWTVTSNMARLIGPTTAQQRPEPWRAVSLWFPPFAFLTVVGALIVWLAGVVNTPDEPTGSSIPLAVGVLCLLASVPLTYLPVSYLADAVRSIGGRATDMYRWMWVPVVLAVVIAGALGAMRIGGVFDAVDGDVPLRPVGLAVFLPSTILVLLAWQAGELVEDAIAQAARKRELLVPFGATSAPRSKAASTVDSGSGSMSESRSGPKRPPVARTVPLDAVAWPADGPVSGPVSVQIDARTRIRQLPGADAVRLAIVVTLACFALLGLIGAVMMFMFWQETVDGRLLPAQRQRAIDAFDALYAGERAMLLAALAMVTVWTAIAVTNVRLASGMRRNPLIAAAAWPVTAVGIWMVGDRFVDTSVRPGDVGESAAVESVIGFALQAALLYVPFVLLERSASAVRARRTPIRITFALSVVVLVYAQGLAGLANISDEVDFESYGRLAGYLAVGSILALASTLAVTESCRSISDASEAMAARHNRLVDDRERVERSRARPVAGAPEVSRSSTQTGAVT